MALRIVGLFMGVITAWVVAYVHMWVYILASFYVISTTFLFIVPLGSLLVGFLGALGVFFANLSRSEDVTLLFLSRPCEPRSVPLAAA